MGAERKLSVAEAAATVGCNPRTILRAIARHELLATREPTKRGRGYIILAGDLHAFIEKRRLA